jgi:glycosyltransferase involved in cell wall biosynthesis
MTGDAGYPRARRKRARKPDSAMSNPKLSVIVIGYNMARELPRTVHSLSPALQRDIAAHDYEVIVIDNGSTQPFELEELQRLGGNISTHRMVNATPSPVPAINHGLALARGDLIGVLIDGARMASPGLLATALDAARLHRRPIIGTLAFHLGPDVQSKSVERGYCQDVEDRLLASVDWAADPYRLFEISVFAGASRRGWFVIPAETNALFLTREHWESLGGYDPAFVTPGGGFSNGDAWLRACSDTNGRIILLLGEATFHQYHGGIATSAAAQSPIMQQFRDEYVRIRQRPFTAPTGTPSFLGQLHPAAWASVKHSVLESTK